jgi:hypothetical protein
MRLSECAAELSELCLTAVGTCTLQIRTYKLWYYIWGEGQGLAVHDKPPVRVAKQTPSPNM